MKSELWDPDRALTTSITAPWMVSRVGVESSGFWGDPFRGGEGGAGGYFWCGGFGAKRGD